MCYFCGGQTSCAARRKKNVLEGDYCGLPSGGLRRTPFGTDGRRRVVDWAGKAGSSGPAEPVQFVPLN
jgi:hypothetical protein